MRVSDSSNIIDLFISKGLKKGQFLTTDLILYFFLFFNKVQ